MTRPLSARRLSRNTRSGASLVFALVFFLVATMVCVVMLSAAMTGVKSVSNDKAWQQDAIELESAGQLLGDMLSNVKVEIDEERASGLEVFVAPESEGKPLAKLLQAAVQRVYDGRSTNATYTTGSDGGFYLDPNESPRMSGHEYRRVYVEFSMSPAERPDESAGHAYGIEATLTLDGSDQRLYVSAYDVDGVAPLEWNSVTLSTRPPGETEEAS